MKTDSSVKSFKKGETIKILSYAGDVVKKTDANEISSRDPRLT